MSDFRTKLLGLAAVSTLFVGASYGQITVAYGDVVAPPNGAPAPGVVAGALNLRGEGTTEIVSPLAFTINNTGAAAASGTVTIYVSAPVTSLPGAAPFTTLATLTLSGSTVAVAAGSVGPGGTSITFTGFGGTGFNFPAGGVTNALVSGVRVNASAVAAGSSLVAVTEQPAVVSNNSSSVAPAPLSIVGYVFPSLSTPAISGNTSSFPAAPVPNYNTAQGNPTKTTLAPSFYVFAGDSVSGAFKTWNGGHGAAGGAGVLNYSTENGDGNASYGTRVQLAFGNVPTGVTLYVPTSITVNNATANVFNLVLVSSAGAADTGATVLPTPTVPPSFTAPNPSLANWTSAFGTPTAYSAFSFPITPSGGTATAVYEVLDAPTTVKVSAAIPVWVTFPASSISAASGAITVIESYAPNVSTVTATTDPEFAAVTTGALNGSSIVLAQTSLLFPFVTSNSGFDTGIALSNTTTDPFGTSPATGTCSLNFYGSGAPTPNTGVAAPGGTQASGTSNAFLLSSVAPNFNGYMIAVCNYPDGHGFGYIVYNFGQNSGATMGYLATILARGPAFAVPAVETLGQ